jgi:hypothetical protein
MRFRLRTLMIVVTVVAAFFGGRGSLSPVLKQHKLREADLESQIGVLEKAIKHEAAMADYRSIERQRLSKLRQHVGSETSN